LSSLLGASHRVTEVTVRRLNSKLLMRKNNGYSPGQELIDFLALQLVKKIRFSTRRFVDNQSTDAESHSRESCFL
jgi:hypothetical protein